MSDEEPHDDAAGTDVTHDSSEDDFANVTHADADSSRQESTEPSDTSHPEDRAEQDDVMSSLQQPAAVSSPAPAPVEASAALKVEPIITAKPAVLSPVPAHPRSPAAAASVAPVLDLRQFLSPPVQDLVYYTRPALSGSFLAAFLVLWAVLFIDFGVPLVWLAALCAKWLLVGTLAVCLGAYVYHTYIRASPHVNPVRQYVFPHLDTAWGHVAPFVPTKETCMARVSAALDAIPSLLQAARDVLACEHLFRTLKVIVALQVLQLPGDYGVGLAALTLLGVGVIFTVPAAYEKHHRAIDPLLLRAQSLVATIRHRVTATPKKTD